MKLSVKVVPSSSRNSIAGWLGDTLKVRVHALAERGEANAAVVQVVATALGQAKENISISSGKTTARKVVEIIGLTESELKEKLERY